MELEELSEIIADVLDTDAQEITEDTRFVEDLGADSLDRFQIVSEVEDKLRIQIPEEALEEIQTVGDALSAIRMASE